MWMIERIVYCQYKLQADYIIFTPQYESVASVHITSWWFDLTAGLVILSWDHSQETCRLIVIDNFRLYDIKHSSDVRSDEQLRVVMYCYNTQV